MPRPDEQQRVVRERDPVCYHGMLRIDTLPTFSFRSGTYPGLWFDGCLRTVSSPTVVGRLWTGGPDEVVLTATLSCERMLTVQDGQGNWFQTVLPVTGDTPVVPRMGG